MKLVLLSSDDKKLNGGISDVVSPLLKGRNLTYIPSCSEGCEPFYRATRRYLEYLGVKKILFFAHEINRRSDAAAAFKRDAIFLSDNAFSKPVFVPINARPSSRTSNKAFSADKFGVKRNSLNCRSKMARRPAGSDRKERFTVSEEVVIRMDVRTAIYSGRLEPKS